MTSFPHLWAGTPLPPRLKRFILGRTTPNTLPVSSPGDWAAPTRFRASAPIEKGEQFFPDEYIYTGQELGFNFRQKSKLTGFITVLDEVGTIETSNGKVDFVKLIGATDAELKAVMEGKLRVQELAEKIGDVTNYTRESAV